MPKKEEKIKKITPVKKEVKKPTRNQQEVSEHKVAGESHITGAQTTVDKGNSQVDSINKKQDPYFKHKMLLLVAIASLLFFNQMHIGDVSALASVAVPLSTSTLNTGNIFTFSGDYDLNDVDVTQIESTAQGIAALFPIDEIQTEADAIAMLIPSGTPEYGEAMGVTFDDPISALNKLQKSYPALKQMAKDDDEVWNRYIALAAAPRGIACEFCCGVGPQGVTTDGTLRCGCAHNPAVQSITLWLMMNTDYTNAEILHEVYLWKGLWFPRNMVTLALQIAGGDTSVLEDLPGMVGGC